MYISKQLFFVIVGLGLILTTSVALAKKTIGDAGEVLGGIAGPAGIDTSQDFPTLMGSIIGKVLLTVGIIFLALMVYAGMRWLLSRGNTEDIEASQKTMIAAVIGLVILVSAYAITTFLTNRVVQPLPTNTSGEEGEAPEEIGGGPAAQKGGCCLDRVGEFVWACRMDTQENCYEQGLTCGAVGDFYCAQDDVIWDGSITKYYPACEERCEQQQFN